MTKPETPYGSIDQQSAAVLEGELRRLIKHIEADFITGEQRNDVHRLREELCDRWADQEHDYRPDEVYEQEQLRYLFGIRDVPEGTGRLNLRGRDIEYDGE